MDSESSDSDDVEKGSIVPEINLAKFIYDLKELKPVMSHMYFSKREFIRYGYRAHPNMTFDMCSKTLLMCHCETGNVWSHLLSAIYFIYQLVLIIKGTGPYSEFGTEESRILQIIGCSAIIFTMTASSIYH